MDGTLTITDADGRELVLPVVDCVAVPPARAATLVLPLEPQSFTLPLEDDDAAALADFVACVAMTHALGGWDPLWSRIVAARVEARAVVTGIGVTDAAG